MVLNLANKQALSFSATGQLESVTDATPDEALELPQWNPDGWAISLRTLEVHGVRQFVFEHLPLGAGAARPVEIERVEAAPEGSSLLLSQFPSGPSDKLVLRPSHAEATFSEGFAAWIRLDLKGEAVTAVAILASSNPAIEIAPDLFIRAKGAGSEILIGVPLQYEGAEIEIPFTENGVTVLGFKLTLSTAQTGARV